MNKEYLETRRIILQQLKLAQETILFYNNKITSSITKDHLETLQTSAEANLPLNGKP